MNELQQGLKLLNEAAQKFAEAKEVLSEKYPDMEPVLKMQQNVIQELVEGFQSMERIEAANGAG